MMGLLYKTARACRRLPVLTGLAGLALLAGMVPAVAATGNGVAAATPTASSGSRCSVAFFSPRCTWPGSR